MCVRNNVALLYISVAKNSSSPDVLKSVLNDLCHQWIIDMAYLSHDHSSVHHTSATSAPYSGIQSRITLKKWLAGKRGMTAITNSNFVNSLTYNDYRHILNHIVSDD